MRPTNGIDGAVGGDGLAVRIGLARQRGRVRLLQRAGDGLRAGAARRQRAALRRGQFRVIPHGDAENVLRREPVDVLRRIAEGRRGQRARRHAGFGLRLRGDDGSVDHMDRIGFRGLALVLAVVFQTRRVEIIARCGGAGRQKGRQQKRGGEPGFEVRFEIRFEVSVAVRECACSVCSLCSVCFHQHIFFSHPMTRCSMSTRLSL